MRGVKIVRCRRRLPEHFGRLPTTLAVTVTAAEVAVAIWVVVVV